MPETRAGPWPLFDRDVVDCTLPVAPLVAWAERALGDLLTVHQRLAADEARAACERLSDETMHAPVRDLIHALVARVVQSRLPGDIHVQRRANLRVVFPREPSHVVQLHADSGAGHCPTGRQLWIPLTPASGTRTLHVAPLAASRSLEFDEAAKLARPVALEVGQVLLFTPDHVHGAVLNESDVTRVSLDVRVAPPSRTRIFRRPLSPSLTPLVGAAGC
jgi:hypothetical protein